MKIIGICGFVFLLWACSNPSPVNIKNDTDSIIPAHDKKIKKVVAVQPLGDFDPTLTSFAADEIRNFYDLNVIIFPSRPLPSLAWYPVRSRYRADSLIDWLAREKPDSVNYIMGLTAKDISCTKDPYPDWGIFGLGFQPGPSCIISIFRLKRNNASDELLKDRFAKVLLHELGHNLGLPHCPTRGCMMEDANGTIVTVDNEKKYLCPLCLKLLSEQ
jgi:archaemetzincin